MPVPLAFLQKQGFSSLEEAEASAQDLFAHGHSAFILTLCAALTPDEQLAYPNLVSEAGRLKMYRKEAVEARIYIDRAIAGFRQQGDTFGLNRALLHQVILTAEAREFQETEARLNALSAKDDLTKARIAAAWGYHLFNQKMHPERAIAAFEQAEHLYACIPQPHSPYLQFEQAKVWQAIATHAYHLGDAAKGRNYEARALEVGERLGNPELLAFLYLHHGWNAELRGEYTLAQQYYQKCQSLCTDNRAYHQQAEWRIARFTLFQENDAAIQAVMGNLQPTGNIETDCSQLILKASHALMTHNEELALALAEHAIQLAQHDLAQFHRARTSRMAVRSHLWQVTEEDLERSAQAAHYYWHDHSMIAGSVFMVAGWVRAVLGQDATPYLTRFLETTQSYDATYIWRLYMLAADDLDAPLGALPGGQDFLALVRAEAALWEQTQQPIRVYTFGRPRIEKGGREILPKQRDDASLSRKLVFALLTLQSATRETLSQILWPDLPDSETVDRFTRLREYVTGELGEGWHHYDAEKRQYQLAEGFPFYYDAREFEAVARRILSGGAVASRLRDSQRLFTLYQGEFLPRVSGDIFQTQRATYSLLYNQIMPEAIKLAETHGRPDLAALWRGEGEDTPPATHPRRYP